MSSLVPGHSIWALACVAAHGQDIDEPGPVLASGWLKERIENRWIWSWVKKGTMFHVALSFDLFKSRVHQGSSAGTTRGPLQKLLCPCPTPPTCISASVPLDLMRFSCLNCPQTVGQLLPADISSPDSGRPFLGELGSLAPQDSSTSHKIDGDRHFPRPTRTHSFAVMAGKRFSIPPVGSR